MKSFWRNLHLWLCAPLGIIIAAICLSGAILVFENEFTDAYCGGNDLAPGSSRLSIGELMPRALAALPDSTEIKGIEISPEPTKAYRFLLAGKGHKSLMVNQYTGEVIGMRQRPPFFNFMHRLHGSLLLKRPKNPEDIAWGNLIIGSSTLLMLLGLITGLILWWPRSRSMLRNGLTISTRHGSFRFWYSIHNTTGFYAFILLLAMCATGLTWSFDWFNKGFYAILGAPQQNAVQEMPAKSPKADDEAKEEPNYAAWQTALDAVAKSNPDKKINVADGNISVTLGKYGNPRAADKYIFSGKTGEITEVKKYADTDQHTKFSGWIGAFHTGTWGGVWSKILYVLAAFIGFTLPISGYWLWIHRLRKKH